ncbi:hypothetical protein [Roseateles asaccharophilus]|uniref:Membrane protein n=1 Tax=Roseateles asaccharophilus TaxID=582607 RepID=A0ABU2AFP4_9BURK|nr:hypothetical protein [Roseateles asaccharophilus]MDR7335292.1 putative membrane protein [Roseateles asaccharophilus]
MHAVIAISALPLFLGALLSDWAYSASFQPQWINFASWLIAGALVLAGLALAWALVDVLRRRANVVYLLLLLATFVLGFVNALIHARDAWATMPTGLALSAVVLVLAAVAGGMGLAGWRRRPA